LSQEAIARRYATALADVGIEKGESRRIQEDLSGWELMLKANPELREVFENPTVAYDQKRKLLTAIIERTKVGPLTANFLRVLLRNGRIGALDTINKEYAAVLDDRSGVVAAGISTARPVPDPVKETIRSQVKQLTGRQARLSFAIDKSLIGGLVTRIGSTIYDGSIRSQLDRFKEGAERI
jgi:F-type H+-transporting ATPase subunit delta